MGPARSSLPLRGEVRAIAVVRALALGDLLCAVPALRSLRSLFPAARITLIGLPWARAFVERFGAYVDAFLEFPGFPGIPERPSDPRAMLGGLASLQAGGWDLAVQLHGSGFHSNAFTALLGASTTIGFVPSGLVDGPPPAPGTWLPYPSHGPEVRRLLRLPVACGGPADEAPEFPLTSRDEADLIGVGGRDALAPGSYAVVHAGASQADRRWPPGSFALVADHLARRGLRVVLTGSEAERPITARLLERMREPAIDLAGRTSLGALGALLRDAALLVSNDTGVSHVAAGVGTPSVVLFSRSDPERWAPLDRERHLALGGVVETAACRHDASEGHRCLGDACTLPARAGEATAGRPPEVDEVIGAVDVQIDRWDLVSRPVRSRRAAGMSHRMIQSTSSTASMPVMPPEGVRRIAVLRAGGIGDLVFAVPALRALAARFPQAEIVLLGHAWQAVLVVRPRGPVDEVIDLPTSVLDELAGGPRAADPAATAFVDVARGRGLDLAVQVHGGGVTSNPLVARLGARLTIGLRSSAAVPLDRTVPYRYWQSEVMRGLEVASLVGAAPAELESRLVPTSEDLAAAHLALALQDPATSQGRPLVVLAPGAGDGRRRWPSQRFGAVAAELSSRGSRRPVVAVVGSDDDRQAAAVIGGIGRGVVDLTGRLGLPELLGVLSIADVVIANDSGPLHLAAAVGTPTVGIYWCGNLVNAGPAFRARHHPVLSWRLDCPTCGTNCITGRCSHDASFVADVSVAEVVDAARRLLAAGGRDALAEAPPVQVDEADPTRAGRTRGASTGRSGSVVGTSR